MKFISEVLKISGYEVLEAPDTTVGISIAREKLPPLILMDIQLPGMDGICATKILKNDEKTKHIKIIATTASAMRGDRERIIEAGCDDYIAKPIRYKELLNKIKSVIK
jgi:two-component system cell cycle response regulator DivK